MQKLLNKIPVILLAVVLLQITSLSNSKYSTNIEQKGKAVIAEPIIILESFENDDKFVNKLDFPLEYQFKIKNYNDNKINEVDFLYNIEVIESNSNFPIKYKIIDTTNNKEIALNNNITENLKIQKQVKDEKTFKIILEWEEKENMPEEIDLKLKLNLKQYKIGEV